jgi:hypothetical protein
MVQVISFDETNAMFSGDSTLHLNSALYHSVHDIFGDLSLGFIEEENCWWLLVGGRLPARGGRGELTVEVAISNVSDYAWEKTGLADIVFRLLDDVGQSAHGHSLERR